MVRRRAGRAALTGSDPLPPMNTTPASDIAGTDWRETWAYLIGMQAYAYGFPAIHATKLRFGMVRQPQGGR